MVLTTLFSHSCIMAEDEFVDEDAVLLEYNGVHEGQRIVFGLLASPYKTSMRWRIRRLLPALQFQESKANTYTDMVKHTWPQWQKVLQRFQIDPNVHALKSMKSLQQGEDCSVRSQAVLLDAREDALKVAWWSTHALIAIVAYWCDKRDKEKKAFTKLFLRCFLERCMQEEVAAGLAVLELEGHHCHCSCNPYGHEQCSRLRQCRQRFLEIGDLHACHRLAEALPLLHTFVQCGCVASLGRAVIHAIAENVDSRVAEWGDKSWTSTKHAVLEGPQRKRNLDEEIRVEARKKLQRGAERDIGDASSKVPGLYHTAQYAHMRQNCLEYKVSGLSSFKPLANDSITVTIDGAKLGKPAKEYLLGMACSCSTDVFAMLVPQVTPLCEQQLMEQAKGGEQHNLWDSALGPNRFLMFVRGCFSCTNWFFQSWVAVLGSNAELVQLLLQRLQGIGFMAANGEMSSEALIREEELKVHALATRMITAIRAKPVR
eukprot:5777108-Amphidinium_carterae.1